MSQNSPAELIGLVIWGAAVLMWIFGYAWILLVIFRLSYSWGIVCLVPPLVYLFGLLYWRESEKPMMVLVVALFIGLLGGGIVKYESGWIEKWEYLVPLPVTIKYLRGP